MQLGRRAQILLIVAVGLAVYYPVIFAEICEVDDAQTILSYKSVVSWSFKDFFFPGSSSGYYYRPLLGLSLLTDQLLFQFNPVLSHLHNVALHLLNALLVYCLALSLLSFRKVSMEWFPLTAALCFCLHPIATESTAWISGRTDLLAGAFVLSSAITALRFRISRRKGYLILSLCLFLLGTLSKEVSLAFFPGMLLILTARGEDGEPDTGQGQGQARVFSLAALATLLLFFLLRSLAYTSNASRIGMTLISMKNDLTHAAMVVLGAFGFYMKKVILPLPLNFAIVEVDPLYQLLAIPLVGFCAYLLSRRTMTSALYLSGVFMIAPSFLIAFNQIAWTPYAERYIYLPTAFMVVAMLFYLGERLPALHPKLGRWLVVALLPVMAATTLARNLTWHSNFSLMKDTVEKSPYFPEARLMYTTKLLALGDLSGAMVQAKLMIPEGNGLSYDERPELILVEILQSQGKIDEAIAAADTVLKKSRGKSVAALQQLVLLWQEKLRRNPTGAKAAASNRLLLESYRLLYAQTKNPAILYSMGGVYSSLRQTGAARGCFQRTIDASPAGSSLKLKARHEIAALGGL